MFCGLVEFDQAPKTSPVFEAVCDAVAARLQAQRAVVSGRGHTIPATGAPYNELLESFLGESESAR